MKKILIFTAGFGEGHNTAARNLRDAIERIAPDEARVEILDLFDTCYGKVNHLLQKTYITAINKTPKLWSKFYQLLDKTTAVDINLPMLYKMRATMYDLLKTVQPDVVVSVYPVYNYIINDIFEEQGREKNFPLVTVITDSISINSMWFRTHSDYFVVANDLSADVLRDASIPDEVIKVLGFPVTPVFADLEEMESVSHPGDGQRKKIFYMLNSGRKQADKIIRRLLEHPDYDLTIAVGKDPKVKAEIEELVADERERVTILGWTSQVPKLLKGHHVIISKAGGATTQEAIAGRCPMIVTQVVPGQEEGNAALIEKLNVGAIAGKPSEIDFWLEKAFDRNAHLWSVWSDNLRQASNPQAALDIADFCLGLAAPGNAVHSKVTTFNPPGGGANRVQPFGKQMLLCDFHMHSRYSDGKLSVTDMVDFYGSRGFDAICITDHIADYNRFVGKMANLSHLVLPRDQVEEYFEVIEAEKKRALKKYGMILLAGLEFNKDGITRKTSAHLLALDLKAPIDPGLSILDTIAKIHEQGGLAVAAHPHQFKSHWGVNTLHFWENQDVYAPLLDAWEIANRDDIFNPVGLKKFPIIANSDFHKPKHIYSWKTMLFCEKDPEAIKDCIRKNQDVAITIYRDDRFSMEQRHSMNPGLLGQLPSEDASPQSSVSAA
ncbi:PHP domain-containing protein [Oscillatoria amoena NRMC-F 0135]|nr:PHP domain-containing protein [Oscillatoria amoena NRMC-F 0135]MDL5053485.1 PHP domain-containing protein [Oscillatoria laete-virens NRMC-F 0139]